MSYIAFNVIIDDIVFPDGQTNMGVLGGGGPQTAFGMRVWADDVALVAAVGSDLPQKVRDDLDALQINLDGLYDLGMSTPRAWQVMEEDGRRTEIWRVEKDVVKASLDCPWQRIPKAVENSKAYHLCLEPLKPAFSFLKDVRANGGVVSVETSELASRQVTEEELHSFVGSVDVFSPNISEAESMVGVLEPVQLIARFIAAGAERVALRMGCEGSLVAEAKSGELVHIPAVQTTVMDPIGAGNAYCGGFLVGWCETGDLRMAGMYGAVSASFLVEQVGLPVYSSDVCKEAQRRLERLHSKLQVSSLPKVKGKGVLFDED